MHNQCVIIILTFITGNEIHTAEDCGTLSASPVKEGQRAKLDFIPHKEYSNHSRKWLHNPSGNKHSLLFDSANTTFMSDKYYEVNTYKGYILIIKEATFDNAEGKYAVQCQGKTSAYSNAVRLDVLKAESVTSVIHTHKGFTHEEENIPMTNVMTSKLPSSIAVNIATTQRQEAKSAITVTNIHRISTDEGEKGFITWSSKQPSTTTVYSVITNKQEVTSYQKENTDEPIKEIPNKSSTMKEKEKLSWSTEEEKGINIEELKLLIPITVSVVGIVVVVAIGTVCLTVRKKKGNEETQIEIPDVESDDKDISHRDGRLAEDVRSPSGVQEQAHPSSNDARSDVLAEANEPPEYASVLPKEKRECEANQVDNTTNNSRKCDNRETETQLVYAELDLQPVNNSRPITSRYEDTEYVSVDFAKTRTSQANTDLPDQQDTTEYVSVDFAKTSTSQANTDLPDQQDTTEHVSVDFSKTAELQTEDQGDGK